VDIYASNNGDKKILHLSMNTRKNSDFGFTMVELLVVISVIGLLASIALVSFAGAQKQARDTQRKSDLKQYQNSLESFAGANGGLFPIYSTATSASDNLCTALDLTNCPNDTKYTDEGDWSPYYYISSGSGSTGIAGATNYVLWAQIESGTAEFWVVCSNGKTGAVATEPTTSTCPGSI